jgi:hypothetical protein
MTIGVRSAQPEAEPQAGMPGQAGAARSTSPGPRYKWIALSNTTLGVFMASADTGVVIIAMPAIFQDSASIRSPWPKRITSCGCSLHPAAHRVHNVSMSASSFHFVDSCFCCGHPAEQPAVGQGVVAGRQEGHLPLCLDCIELLLADPEAFWRTVRERRGRQP